MLEKKSEADWAYQIIEERQGPVHYRELVEEILKRMNREVNSWNMSSVYTQLNLDNRLTFTGEGYWGIKHR